MTKIDIFSGFLGAGKTTLIKKLIKEGYSGEKLVLIENEFGEIGIDGGFLKDAGIEITEMNSGCICCSLVGDFGEALKKVLAQYAPDRIIIEPSGVGKLSDVIKAVRNIDATDILLNSFTTVVDAKKCKMYMKNFGEFFNNQIEYANCIILSHTGGCSPDKLKTAMELIRQHNQNATIISTDWDALSGAQIIEAMEQKNSLQAELDALEEETCPVCGHDHHEHAHHEHEHDHEHHDHDHDCGCGHDHEHHHEHGHHHADEVFQSWGAETAKVFSKEQITNALQQLTDAVEFGVVLRAKGIVAGENGQWIHFDYVPGTPDVRFGTPSVTGRLCVIGSKLEEENLKELFGV